LNRHQNFSFEFHHLVIVSFLFSLILILFFNSGLKFILQNIQEQHLL